MNVDRGMSNRVVKRWLVSLLPRRILIGVRAQSIRVAANLVILQEHRATLENSSLRQCLGRLLGIVSGVEQCRQSMSCSPILLAEAEPSGIPTSSHPTEKPSNLSRLARVVTSARSQGRHNDSVCGTT